MARIPVLVATGATVPSGYKHLATTLLGAPAASISMSGLSTSNLQFRLTTILKPATDGVSLRLRVNNDSAANYDNVEGYQENGAVFGQNSTGQTSSLLNTATGLLASNARWSFYVTLAGKPLAGVRGLLATNGLLMEDTGPTLYNVGMTANWNNAAALISRFDVLASSGNLSATSMMRVEGLIP